MADFLMAVKEVLEEEGGLSDDPRDHGGLTKYGISQRSYPSLDIAALTREQAIAIYKRDFWDPLKLSEIRDQCIASKVFDMAVNGGLVPAAKMLQRSLCEVGYDLVVDGHIGPQTLTAVNSYHHPRALLNVMTAFRVNRYLDICAADPSQRKWLNGWLNRA